MYICCTDKALAMLETKSGFQAYDKKQSLNVKSVHCMIHYHALAFKMLLALLCEVLDETILMVHFIKERVLNF